MEFREWTGLQERWGTHYISMGGGQPLSGKKPQLVSGGTWRGQPSTSPLKYLGSATVQPNDSNIHQHSVVVLPEMMLLLSLCPVPAYLFLSLYPESQPLLAYAFGFGSTDVGAHNANTGCDICALRSVVRLREPGLTPASEVYLFGGWVEKHLLKARLLLADKQCSCRSVQETEKVWNSLLF